MTRSAGAPAAGRGPVLVVTDSTSYLPAGVDEQLGIVVVPLQVIIDGVVRPEGSAISPAAAAHALTRGATISTSRPSPRRFVQTYRQAFADGARAVVSIHLSGSISGTVEAATSAVRDVDGDVRVVDSRSVGMGCGFGVIAAAEAARAGADAGEVVAAAERVLAGTSAIFYVDTLEFLRRGGRIGATAALVGGALSVKPLLELREGRIEPLERVRTASRALTRLQWRAVDLAGSQPVAIAVHHLAAPRRAEELAAALDVRVPHVVDMVVCEIGAVVGAHTGPGTIAVVVSRR